MENTDQPPDLTPQVQMDVQADAGQERHGGRGEVVKTRQSVLGIVSFIGAVTTMIIFLFCLIVGVAIDLSTPGGLEDDSLPAMILGLVMAMMWGFSLLTLGLGIGGLVQQGTSKVFSCLGIVISCGSLLMLPFLIVVGLLVE